MAVIRVLQGKASRLTQTATGTGRQAVHKASFLVGNHPAAFYGTCHLGEGDQVTLAGLELAGEFRAYAMRNDATGVEYLAPSSVGTSIFALLLGVLVSMSGIVFTILARFGLLAFPLIAFGLLFLTIGAAGFVQETRNQQANQALAEARGLPRRRAKGKRRAGRKLAQAAEERGAARTIAGVAVGTLGMGLIGMAILLTIAVFQDLFSVHELGRGSAIFLLLVFLATGIGGFNMARWGFGKRAATAHVPVEPEETPDRLAGVRKRVLAVAQDHGGRVTAAELAAELSIERAPAARVLEEAAEAGDARLLFTPEGDEVYEFQGLVTRKAEAKEPWEL
jgi:hypothetical protein